LKAGFTFVPAEKLFIFQFHNPAGTRIVSKKFRLWITTMREFSRRRRMIPPLLGGGGSG
jgi:hypothetical protein